MTDDELAATVSALAALAAANECRLIAHLPPGASNEDLDRTEAFIGSSLPTSLRRFLQAHDGLSLAFSDNDSYQRYGDRDAPFSELHVYSARDVVDWTIDFGGFIDAASARVRDQTRRCYDIANVLGIRNRLVFFLDAPRSNGEYAIIDADVGCGEWMEDLDRLSSIVIADSFDDFLRQALGFMLDTKHGFSYRAANSKVKFPRPHIPPH